MNSSEIGWLGSFLCGTCCIIIEQFSDKFHWNREGNDCRGESCWGKITYLVNIRKLLSLFSILLTDKTVLPMQYMDVPREQAEGTVTVHPSWPKEGIIEFERVSLRYKPTLPAALNNLSFRIMGGLKVLFIMFWLWIWKLFNTAKLIDTMDRNFLFCGLNCIGLIFGSIAFCLYYNSFYNALQKSSKWWNIDRKTF